MTEHASPNRFIDITLGRYKIASLLEQNLWGSIFMARAEGEETGEYIVRLLIEVKRLSPTARMLYLGQFQQEANRLIALNHPHILSPIDYGNYEGMPYLVYPSVQGVSLRALLAQKGAVDVARAGRYLNQLASALDYAHVQGVIHRNLSTTCIFRQQDGKLLITEFGLVRLFELLVTDEQTGKISDTFLNCLSSESSAPEQILTQPTSATTDIYALGAICYRLLSNHAPFEGKGRAEIFQLHLNAPVPPLSHWRKDLSGELDAVLATALAKDPLQRFRNASLFVNACRSILSPAEVAPAPIIAVPAYVAPAPIIAAPVYVAPPQPPVRVSTSGKREAKGPVIVAHERQKRQSSRRRFMVLAAGGGVGAIVVVALGAHFFSGATSANNSAATTGTQSTANGTNAGAPVGNVLAKVADVPKNSAKNFSTATQPKGILVHLPDDSFVAFDTTCPHAGCAVDYKPQEKILKCPCHGAIFDPAKNAAVLQGPAQTPLRSIKITVGADGTITEG